MRGGDIDCLPKDNLFDTLFRELRRPGEVLNDFVTVYGIEWFFFPEAGKRNARF